MNAISVKFILSELNNQHWKLVLNIFVIRGEAAKIDFVMMRDHSSYNLKPISCVWILELLEVQI